MYDNSFNIHPYSKRELARLYFPDTKNLRSAMANLRNMIQRCEPLYNALLANGCNLKAHYYTARQVRLIVEHVGEPWDDGQ